MSQQDPEKSSRVLPPGQSRVKRILKWGDDHSAITPTIPRLDVNHWTLRIDGDVETSVRLRWSDLLQSPTITTSSDFHCVEGWSVIGCEWTGVAFHELVQIVHPTPRARFVTVHGADGYTTSLPLEAMRKPDVLLAHRLNGEPLPPELGGPLRLVVPEKYAYKSAMWVTWIHFTSKEAIGYWERQGYSQTADVWTNDRYSPARAQII